MSGPGPIVWRLLQTYSVLAPRDEREKAKLQKNEIYLDVLLHGKAGEQIRYRRITDVLRVPNGKE